MFDSSKILKEWEELEYNTFRRWFDKYPNLKDPDIAITQSVARNIARLVYDALQKRGGV